MKIKTTRLVHIILTILLVSFISAMTIEKSYTNIEIVKYLVATSTSLGTLILIMDRVKYFKVYKLEIKEIDNGDILQKMEDSERKSISCPNN